MKPLLLLAAVVAPLAAQCTFTVNPAGGTTSSVPAAGGTGMVTVTVEPGCTWKYSVAQTAPAWFTITSTPAAQVTIMGSGSISWSATATTTANSRRTATITIQPQVTGGPIAVNYQQDAPACSLALSAQSAGIGVGGGSGSFDVTTNCSWSTGSSTASWFHVTRATGTGNGTVNYTVDPNGCVIGRNASVTLVQVPVSPTFTIHQDGSVANLTVAPAVVTVPAAATKDPVTVQVVTGAGCAWSSSKDVSWVRATSGASGTGTVNMLLMADANPNPEPRTGHITVIPGNAVLTVTQQGTPAPVPQLNTVKNAASYALAADAAGGATGAVAPGEIVMLEGTALGPQSAASLQLSPDGLSITRALAGVQVMFDDTPAALTYVSDVQINAIVPYGVTGSTKVKVQYQNGSSNVLSVPVQDTAPALFTQDASGHGGASVINQDGHVNSPGYPAPSGSWVSIYCNGGGKTNPASVDAALTGLVEPFPRLVAQDVSVTIGGTPSPKIWYAGGTPSVVSGLTQITADVPNGLPSGPNAVVVQIGGRESQANVTIYVQ